MLCGHPRSPIPRCILPHPFHPSPLITTPWKIGGQACSKGRCGKDGCMTFLPAAGLPICLPASLPACQKEQAALLFYSPKRLMIDGCEASRVASVVGRWGQTQFPRLGNISWLDTALGKPGRICDTPLAQIPASHGGARPTSIIDGPCLLVQRWEMRASVLAHFFARCFFLLPFFFFPDILFLA